MQFPIQMHENALYACLNLVQCASNEEKQTIVTSGLTGPLCQFIADLASLEFESIKQVKKTYVADYGILMNPEFAGIADVAMQDQGELAVSQIR